MSSEEVERQLARLGRLADVAGERLATLGRNVEALRKFIDEIEAAVVRENEKAADGTPAL